MRLGREFSQPFERLTFDGAGAILADTWGIADATLERLDSERDDSFHVTAGEHEFVLKVAHPADDRIFVNLQTAAMSFAAELEPRLPLQRVLLTLGGEVEPVVGGRVARLLTWLPGHPLDSHAGTRMLGETLGMLNAALSTFDHPAAHRDFVWDVARLDLVRGLHEQFPHPEVARAFELWDQLDLGGLPRQVVHNDFHPGNVLSDGDRLTGILDFGDTVFTARVVDLAVALCYFGFDNEFIDGFQAAVPLNDDEWAALPVLVAARYVQRILLNELLGRFDPTAHLASLRDHLERFS